jgi:hypothetical protein
MKIHHGDMEARRNIGLLRIGILFYEAARRVVRRWGLNA